MVDKPAEVYPQTPYTLRYKQTGNLILALQSAKAPSAEDWEGYVNLYRTGLAGYANVRILVISDGGAPSNRQQMTVNELVAGLPIKIAIVSRAPSVVQVVRRLLITNDAMRLFQPDDLAGAYAFLDVDHGERSVIRQALAELRPQLAGWTTPASRHAAMTAPLSDKVA